MYQQNVENGHQQASNKERFSPIVLVRKPDGSESFCVDYIKVNADTAKYCFPIPSV